MVIGSFRCRPAFEHWLARVFPGGGPGCAHASHQMVPGHPIRSLLRWIFCAGGTTVWPRQTRP